MSKTMLTAHAGSDGYRSNSKEFIEQMLKCGVDALEVDVRSHEGYLYLSHDALSEAELEDALSLESCFELMAGYPCEKTLINLDCKEEDVGLIAITLAKKYDLYDRIFLTGSHQIANYSDEDLNKIWMNIEVQDHLSKNNNEMRAYLQELYLQGIRYINTHYQFASLFFLSVAQEIGLAVSVWTIDQRHIIDYFKQLSVYNITSNSVLEYTQGTINNRIVYASNFMLTELQNKSNIRIPFNVPKGAYELHISFQYDPSQSSDAVAIKQIVAAKNIYPRTESEKIDVILNKVLPIDNLLTLSLSKDGRYLGGYHNKNNDISLIINEDYASLGFETARIEPAEWELQINCHCIASKCIHIKLKIEVYCYEK